ncbi:hypothetical protein [Pseudomonas aeruginosa]|uniref:hypothetical protein n=1 Tax=Pseudomonas aeruginosa TaxID=287 RepID=UPI00229DAD33|nr:hypothetical protein [Pseudomonas aeruginosa]EKV0492046.1 hypothetical protein [Pseudomonas aeruginosa]MDI3708888.1 hypothetical protein [Pseudomonas aeruginosa]HBO3607837.1 hypothetical protein [Pseudomonas aeruginosa]HCE9344407.1 hypothetical protein [Pseudomonas aeruginosa]HCW0300683.1 hypothetical protein [Pseudomonas aeruginosa]
MPHPDGTLKDEEFIAVSRRLYQIWEEAHGGPPICPSCGKQDFFIHPALLGNRSDTLSPLSQHTRLPTIAKYCKNCGHMTEYVARMLGIEVLTVENKNG